MGESARCNAKQMLGSDHQSPDFSKVTTLASRFMASVGAFFPLILLGLVWTQAAAAQASLGPQGAEGDPNREQQWLVPSPDPDRTAHAVLFRPPGEGAFSPGGDRPCHDPERSASRSNAAAGIPRACRLAGGARLCRAGAGASGPWRYGGKISRGPGRV